MIIDSCLRTVSGRTLASFCCAWWQIVRDFINVFVWGIQTWELGEICFVPPNYHVKHLVHLDVICVLAGYAVQTGDCRCLAFLSQITQVISVCHKKPNSSTFQAVMCIEVALCLFWNLGWSREEVLKIEIWKMETFTFYAIFWRSPNLFYVWSCDCQWSQPAFRQLWQAKCSILYQAAQYMRSFNIIWKHLLFLCLTNSHAFLGMCFRCSAESSPTACLRQIPIFPEGPWNTPDAVQSWDRTAMLLESLAGSISLSLLDISSGLLWFIEVAKHMSLQCS